MGMGRVHYGSGVFDSITAAHLLIQPVRIAGTCTGYITNVFLPLWHFGAIRPGGVSPSRALVTGKLMEFALRFLIACAVGLTGAGGLGIEGNIELHYVSEWSRRCQTA